MLTFLKQIFIWWNQQTLSTRIQTFFFGRFVGIDNFGNKYYESKSGKRWVIYKDEIDASKIPNEWYSWMHFIKNRIEKSNNIKKYNWQKPHLSNQTGTNQSYHPKKIMKLPKNIKGGKIKILISILLLNFCFFLFLDKSNSKNNQLFGGKFLEIKILDKISSKTSTVELKIGEEIEFKNLLIKSLKCENSKFDDNPEITAYIQVIDKTKTNNDEVFVFNGWAFSSSPSISPFDHPVYDIWLMSCF